MISAILGVIIALIVIGVIWWAIDQLLPLIPLPEPIRKIIYVLMMVLLVFIVLWVIVTLLAPLAGIHLPVWVRGGLVLPIAWAGSGRTAYLH